MIEELFSRALSYIVDCNGTTDKGLAKKFFARSISSQWFDTFDAERNEFVQTPYSMIFDFTTKYYATYGEIPSDTTIRRELNNNAKLLQSLKESVVTALANISNYEPTGNEFEYTLDELQSNWLRHSVLNICLSTNKRNANNPLSSLEYAQNELARIHSLVTYSESINDKTLFLEDSYRYALEEFRTTGTIADKPIPFGFTDWDSTLGGMFPGELIVIVGPTGVGKSQLSRFIAYNAAFNLGLKVAVADREMLRRQNILRLLSYKTKIPSRKLRRPVLMTEEEKKLIETYMEEEIAAKRNNFLMIPPVKCANATMIKREIEASYGGEKPDLILIDYLDELEPSRKMPSSWESKAHVTQELKGLATHFECPVLTLSQFNSKGFNNPEAGLAEMSWKDVAKKADGVITLVQDPDCVPIPPGPGEMIGTPGILNARVAKYRGEATGYLFRLEAEFSTSSIRALPPLKSKTKIGKLLEQRDDQAVE